MSYQTGTKCNACAENCYPLTLQTFTCIGCHTLAVGRHMGNWRYCDACAAKKKVCPMCGETMPPTTTSNADSMAAETIEHPALILTEATNDR